MYMILAAVDDLLFTSKIRAAAAQLGREVVFARSARDVVDQARASRPGLALFDLNSAGLDPLAAIAALKGDPALASIRTVAFVSHVQADLVAAARAAGADEVLARSAFTARLGEILQGG